MSKNNNFHTTYSEDGQPNVPHSLQGRSHRNTDYYKSKSKMEEEVVVSPPPPPVISPIAKPKKLDLAMRSIINRHGLYLFSAKLIILLYYMQVAISSEDKRVVESKGVGRKAIAKLFQTYSSELAGKRFAYDGEKTLYTVGSLPQNKLEFTVLLEESFVKHGNPSHDGSSGGNGKRSKWLFQSKSFKVEISYAAKIPLKSISLALNGSRVESVQDALRVLDIALRQQAANRGCLLVRQSFFYDDSRNFTDVGGGITACRGFHSSFRPTHGGLSLNMGITPSHVSTTMILKPGPVIDFLLANQNARDPRYIDWAKAKKMLKSMRVKSRHRNWEYKIIGLSEKPCNQQFFPLKVKNGDGKHDGEQTLEITVYEYFTKHLNIELICSANMPCLDVGKPKRPNYLPLEAVTNYRYEDDPFLAACGISIEKQLTPVDGRVLEAPKLKVGNNEDCLPRNGRWNFNNKQLFTPIRIERWAVVNFSARCDTSHLSEELINCGRNKGIHMKPPFERIEEDPQYRRSSPVVRVENMFEEIKAKLPGPPQFLLCILPEKRNSDIYGPWKKKSLCDFGIATQCISPSKINDQYLTNVLLKINTKLGGTNSLLAIEHSSLVPMIKDTPTMILGMDVSHGSPGQSDVPSIAAVVGSRSWPLISRYRAAVRTQSSKVEMVESLYKPLANGKDDGIMRELLLDFYQTSNECKPAQIILFRDGVSESQFNQVLEIELNQMIKAYQHLFKVGTPKFTVIVAQKNHHTKLFQAIAPENVPPGTIVDTKVVHPRNYDFYMCAQAGMIGTSRPAHYHVLLDEIGFSPDDLQNLIHSLSYVYQRSTTAISIVAPVCYAHLAAQQMSQFMKFEDLSETSSGQKGLTSVGTPAVPELPRLHKNVEGSMFFC
ncbi:Protein argonaute 16 [Sarracenia purpurea var. burkii]